MIAKKKFESLCDLYEDMIKSVLNAYQIGNLTKDEVVDIMIDNKQELLKGMKMFNFSQEQYAKLYHYKCVMNRIIDEYEVIHCEGY